MREKPRVSPLIFLLCSTLLCLLAFVPLALCNNWSGAVAGVLSLEFLFFFPGYLLLRFFKTPTGALGLLLSFVVGIVSITTVFNFVATRSSATYFLYSVLFMSCVGIVLLIMQARRSGESGVRKIEDYEHVIAGCLVALAVAPLYWRSGRFSNGNFVFYGPAGQDPLFHVTLLQRLLHHVPPDNFIVAGLRAPVYHYFDDLTLALTLSAQKALHLGSTDLFDLYYRCYPTIIYFLLGALAYRIGKLLVGTTTGGILGALLLLGAGGLGPFLGALQTAAHASHLSEARAWMFTDWSSWNGVDAILPLVHRPAHYHSLLICLAALCLLLRQQCSRRDWMLAGLLLGLMAGFNFTLAATFGISAVLAAVIFLLRREGNEARNVAQLAFLIFIGSLPVTVAMLRSGFHSQTAGFPFRGPNLEFTTQLWGGLLGRFLPKMVAAGMALIVFPIIAYGIKLLGIGRLARFDIGEARHRGIAMVLAVVFVLSFVVGTFFPFQAQGGIAVIFIQPTLWILALFSLSPLAAWLERHKQTWRFVAVWGLLGLTWIQLLAAFNLGRRAAFSEQTASVFQEIRSEAAPDNVVAYMPSELTETAVLGHATTTTNFSITALAGLDGYVSSESYSTSFAVPGLRGRDPAEVSARAEQIYAQRRSDVEGFLKGEISSEGSGRLAADHVCWVVAMGDALRTTTSVRKPWRRTNEVAAYRLCP